MGERRKERKRKMVGVWKRDRKVEEAEDKELVEDREEEIKHGAEKEDLQEVLQIRIIQRTRKTKILPKVW